MALDPDVIRIDLLKLKRKIYLSYPEGSKERNDYLLKGKLSEISYLSRIVPEEAAKIVFEEYKTVMRSEILEILFCIGLGLILSYGTHALHTAFPKSFVWSCWPFFTVWGCIASLRHFYHIFYQWKGMKPFKREYAAILQQINKLKRETGQLE